MAVRMAFVKEKVALSVEEQVRNPYCSLTKML
jgi:hypothetical protein